MNDFFLLQKMKVVLLALVLSLASMAYCQDAFCLAGRLSNSDVSNCATELAVSLLQSTKTIDILTDGIAAFPPPPPPPHAIVLSHYKHFLSLSTSLHGLETCSNLNPKTMISNLERNSAPNLSDANGTQSARITY